MPILFFLISLRPLLICLSPLACLFSSVSFTTPVFLFISPLHTLYLLFPLFPKLILYSHFNTSPSLFLLLFLRLLFCPQFPLSSLSLFLYPPPSLFLCLSLTPSPCGFSARSLESVAEQRLFEKKAKRFATSCVVHICPPYLTFWKTSLSLSLLVQV